VARAAARLIEAILARKWEGRTGLAAVMDGAGRGGELRRAWVEVLAPPTHPTTPPSIVPSSIFACFLNRATSSPDDDMLSSPIPHAEQPRRRPPPDPPDWREARCRKQKLAVGGRPLTAVGGRPPLATLLAAAAVGGRPLTARLGAGELLPVQIEAGWLAQCG
jgi:hypothetical protein